MTSDFYSRPCGRGDGFAHVSRIEQAGISTHAPAGGATALKRRSSARKIFLLTPLREGRPMATATVAEQYIISTHAPAGGATPAAAHRR